MDDGKPMLLQSPATRFIGVYGGRINAKSDLGKVWKASAVVELVTT